MPRPQPGSVVHDLRMVPGHPMTLCRESGVSFQRQGSPEPVHYNQCPACGASDITLTWCQAERWFSNAGTGMMISVIAGMAVPPPDKWFTLTVPDHEVPDGSDPTAR